MAVFTFCYSIVYYFHVTVNWELPYLADDGEAWVEVGETARGEGGAARGELQEGLPLVWGHPAQHPHKAQEARAVKGRAKTKSGRRLPLTFKVCHFQSTQDT